MTILTELLITVCLGFLLPTQHNLEENRKEPIPIVLQEKAKEEVLCDYNCHTYFEYNKF